MIRVWNTEARKTWKHGRQAEFRVSVFLRDSVVQTTMI
jgi:hypothetical protein